MKHAPIAALCLFILFASAAADAAKLDDYAQSWPLTLSGDGAAWQLELTPEVYAAISDPQLRDLDVLDGAGAAVPLAAYFSGALQTTPGTLLDLPVFNLPAVATASNPSSAADDSIRLHIERAADGRLRSLDAQAGQADGRTVANAAPAQGDLLLDASAIKEPLDSLRVDWADNGGSVTAKFSISVSDDLQSWRSITSATVLRLKQDDKVLDRHDIALNGVRANYLRVHRGDDGAAMANLVVHARTAAHSTSAGPSRQWLDAALVPNDAPKADAPTIPPGTLYQYTLPAALAVRALKLDLAADNSLARVTVLNRGASVHSLPSAWMTVADFVAFRLRQGDALLGNDEVSVASIRRAQEWQIRLETPLDQAPQLHVAFLPERFVFLAQGQGPYRLVAGSARARRSDYPVDAALATLRTSLGKDWQPPLASIGPRATLQGERAMLLAPAAAPVRDWKTWLLWAVLAGAALLIGAMALSLLRGTKAQ